ncbi:unnamed protein product [Clonostachys solani]|uniref:Carrier domain-containing protein n=1 Tax=Clonostachys solani TaxID=160281 RepID=A0A9N9ZEA9_9HYPO|nr:unnamed protein product [Clonostachys solani]
MKIAETMPDIAGVVQGAMVLHDAIFLELQLEQLQQVLRPKVDGSKHLDEVFPEDTLEFFIYLSSLAYIVGNPGQSAYAAANAFMASLAANRRRRGLAASVINIAGVKGEGYVARRLEQKRELTLQKGGFPFIPLRAFHEAYAEAILASNPRSDTSFEISTILRVPGKNRDGQAFSSNPIFQHLVTAEKGITPQKTTRATGSALSIKEAFLKAKTNEDVFRIVKLGLLAKVRLALQSDLEDNLMLHQSPDKMGIDSLVAVDIQSWFRNELSLEMPTLKILNAASMNDILEYACSQVELTSQDQDAVEAADETSGSLSLEETTASSTPLDPSGHVETDCTSSTDAFQTCDGAFSERDEDFSDERHFERTAPMSFAQSRFWFLNSYVEDQSAFNVTSLCCLRGTLDIERLERAFTSVIQHHEALRTVLYIDVATRQLTQGVVRTSDSPCQFQYSNVNQRGEVDVAIKAMQSHVFDLSKGESVFLRVLRLKAKVYFLVLGYHHIYMDGVGHQIFHADLEKAYQNSLEESKTSMLQYPDFTLRQISEHKRGAWSKQLAFWRDQLGRRPSALPLLSLSRTLSRPKVSSFGSFQAKIRLDEGLSGSIATCCRQLGVTRWHFFLAVFNVLLFRFTNNPERDICIGVADANRKTADVLHSLGLFLDILPLKLSLEPDQSFTETVKNVKEASDAAFANSGVPFDLILAELGVPRSTSHTPLFQSFFNYRQNIQETWEFCGCEAEGELISAGQDAYDVSLDVLDSSSGKGELVTISANSALYTQNDAVVLAKCFVSLLTNASRNPAAKITRAILYREEDVQDSIAAGRGPEFRTEWGGTMIDHIAKMAEKYPDRLALVNGFKHQRLSYQSMATRVNQILTELHNRGVTSGSRVGVFQTAGPDWICSFLAIRCAGATCVPLDLRVGKDRLLLIVRDCSLALMLVDAGALNTNQDLLMKTGIEMVDVSGVSVSDNNHSTTKTIRSRAKACQDSIITYTSGSTGTPKGIILKDSSLLNFVEDGISRWKLEEGKEIILHQSSYAFDMAMCQILVCLGSGGTLVCPKDDERHDPQAICSIIASERVTFTIATPTEYLAWIRSGWENRLLQGLQWNKALSGGEPMTESLVNSFSSLARPQFCLINGYGPAETTFACADCIVPLGAGHGSGIPDFAVLSPMSNISIRIVDEDLKPVPCGVPGQILVAGAGVARGYLNQQSLTDAAFVADHEASEFAKEKEWATAHLSGDRGRLDSSGRLTLEGRVRGSTQVKLRGLRVDLEEIENAIFKTMMPSVEQVVVSLRTSSDSDTQYLVAFVVWPRETRLGQAPRKELLSQLPELLPLPHYMKPSLVVEVDKIPTTFSGKIDRAAVDILPLPVGRKDECQTGPSYDTRNSEALLRQIWAQVLPTDVSSRTELLSDTDFFHVGGSSLALIHLQAILRERLDISLRLDQLFGATTLREMADLIYSYDAKSENPRPYDVDWELEAALPPDLVDVIDEDATKPTIPPSIIALTGATGFLGQEVLSQLIDNGNVTKIYCLAVRKAKDSLPALFQHPKVAVCMGDLAAPRIGLSPDAARSIFLNVDAVLHMGADVSFLKSYRSLFPVNVGSTQELVRLSLPRRIPFHFVSTAAVAQLTGLDDFGPFSVGQWQPGPVSDGQNAYTASKWVSEVFLEHVSRRFGLPVLVHRPSSVTGNQAPSNDLMSNLLKFAKITTSVPRMETWRGSLDLVSVSTAARLIIGHVLSKVENLEYVYQSGEVVLPLHQLAEFLSKTEGKTIRVVNLRDWIELVSQAGMDPLLVAYLKRLDGEAIVFPNIHGQ